MRLALAQLRIEPGAVEDNVERARSAVADAAAAGADLVALPEIFNVGYFAFDLYERRAESVTGPTVSALAESAREHGVGVLAGSIVEDLAASQEAGVETPASEGFANASVFLDRDGERRAVYRKHHLFGYGSAEQELLVPGKSLPTVPFDDHVVGMTTCYDLRFPSLYRELADAGATLVLVPSAWPYPRVEHWRLFPRTRAVENLCYVGAVNGVGTFDDSTLLGRSAVYDPWGTPLASTGDESALVTAEVDRDRVDDVRNDFPALDDRRR
ncbi:nitrilase-related carbon-nitrogen hydrolase [Halosimplex amylolyticum]|uniref:nitrilase-related carbon-nitrogen hydrolase n=1 Tax=Halosimplex amylolyticum TaxID=3396616 RepID=UPI003F549D03